VSEDKDPLQREEIEPEPPSTIEPAPAAARAALNTEPGQVPDKPGGGTGVAWLALLLVFGLSGGAGWLSWQAQERESDLLRRLAALEAGDRLAAAAVITAADQSSARTEMQALQQQFGGLQPQLQEQQQAVQQQGQVLQEQAARLQILEAQLGEQRSELAKLSGGDQDSWLLAEVEYLLRLANQRLLMARDTVSARGLLHSADTILRQLDDVALHPVRRAVAADTAALRALPEIDTEGLYLRLSALADQVGGLVLFELPEREIAPTALQAEDWQQRLRQGYEEALDTLSHYVTVRRREMPFEALVDPQWEALLRQNLVMLLQQAQVALLSGNQPLYHASLQRARHWLAEYYLAEAAATTAVVRELDDLLAQPIALELPDISSSLRALDEVMEQRLQRGASK
jgi:uroporphyrin-III C-methyltransferase